MTDEFESLKAWCETERIRLRDLANQRYGFGAFDLANQSVGALHQTEFFSHMIDCIRADRVFAQRKAEAHGK